ncbi:MAG: hypothetical protein BWK76_17870 [Desulfobulbaceae bacterium A2]|nr:MAG: hypothetical protein BWK76_17870 [Desulfobulbaceae bacterium A2]
MTRYTVGLDMGTGYTKALVLDADGRLLARCLEKTGFHPEQAARRCLATILASTGLARPGLDALVSTGFYRRLLDERSMAVTELTAAVRGALHLFPATRVVLDIGSQTIKASRYDADGRITGFRLNDKCAAGTGAFLERTARIMNIALEDIDGLSAAATAPAPISSVCAVFAESEIINQLVQGTSPGAILLGAFHACVQRAAQLAVRVGTCQEKVCLLGGVTRFQAVAALLAGRLPAPHLPPNDMRQFVAALGAAHLGLRFGGTRSTQAPARTNPNEPDGRMDALCPED